MVRSAKVKFNPDRTFRDPWETPAYSLSAAAHYLRVHENTLRYWVRGGRYRAKAGMKRVGPVIHLPDPASAVLSFYNLAEAHVLCAFRRQHHLQLSAIRRAVKYIRDLYGTDHPLLSQNFATDGVALFIERLGELVDASAGGQKVMRAVVEGYLKRLKREDTKVTALFPFTRQVNALESPKSILIDPHRSFGQPVLADCYIATSVIAERYRAGESIESLTEDYGCERLQIEEALRYEFPTTAA